VVAGGVGGGLERPDAHRKVQEALRVVTGFEAFDKDFSIINLLALPRAPRRSRPVSLRLGHAAALDANGIHSLPRRRFVTSALPASIS
jgi:hypothetical protein